jgi:hypothetical protein
MHFNRFSIAGLMGVVLISALGLAALRSVSETTAGITLLVACAALALAVVGAICRTGSERAWWLGFAVFGWGYLNLAFWSHSNETTLPTIIGLTTLFSYLGLTVPTLPTGPTLSTAIDPSFIRTGHFVLSLIIAALGGILASALFGRHGLRSTQADDGNGRRRLIASRIGRRKPAAIALSGLAVAVMVTAIGSFWTPPTWAGLTFLTTCVLLALTVLGAIVASGRARQVWLGAALFGWGYMFLAFGWHPFHSACPYLITSQWLDGLRPSLPPKLSGFPPCDDRTDPANARILAALEQRIRMHFPEPTALEEILIYVKKATGAPDGWAIPIYVDPVGLQEAERSMTSTAQVDLENYPLKSTLGYYLRQLDLTYVVKTGYLMIAYRSEADVEILPMWETPFLIVGHSLIALLVAAFGAAAAPLVAGQREDRVRSGSDEAGQIVRPSP